jgi:hypothetical protein
MDGMITLFQQMTIQIGCKKKIFLKYLFIMQLLYILL